MDTNNTLPLDGECHLSKNKKYNEVVVLIHHFGGSKILLRRHTDFLNELGFDVVVFNLECSSFKFKLPISKRKLIGSRYVWEDNIHSILDSISESKILFSFSFPSISACRVISQRKKGEIKAWIADGGPFLSIEKNFLNYLKYISGVKFHHLRKALLAFSLTYLGVRNYYQEAVQSIKDFPDNIPILSIRSERDKLIPEASIDIFFNQAPQIKYKAVSMKGADHLQGLKDCPADYKKTLSSFLREHLVAIKTSV